MTSERIDTGQPGERFRKVFLVVLAIAISLLFLRMIWSYVVALVLAGIFAGLAQPLQHRLAGRLRGRTHLAAAVVILLVLLSIVGPVTALLGIVVAQAVEVSRSVAPWVQEQLANPSGFEQVIDQVPILRQLVDHVERIPTLAALIPERDVLIAKAGETASHTAQFVADSLAAGTRGTARFLLTLFIMLYAMFFFLIDGRSVLTKLLYYLPLRSEDESLMLDRFTSVTRATLKGTLVIGIVQGFLAGLAFAVAGIKAPLFWGTIMAVLSIIPGVGIALVWVPAAGYLALTGRVLAAVCLIAWCVGVAGTIDNVLRPRLVGKDTKLSDLLILISTLGGLTLFGAVGILIGPIVAALFVTVWDLYGRTFADVLPEVTLVGGEVQAAAETTCPSPSGGDDGGTR